MHSTGGVDDAGDGSAPENACREATPAHANGWPRSPQRARMPRRLRSIAAALSGARAVAVHRPDVVAIVRSRDCSVRWPRERAEALYFLFVMFFVT
jgi:hypothetical protein